MARAETTIPKGGAATRPTLSPHRAFVVQIRADVEPAHEALGGRVEHLTSGTAAHFTTVQQLVTFIRNRIERLRKGDQTS